MNIDYIKDVELLKQFSVMHVEDDNSVRESLMRFLKRRFDTIYSAKDGAEGLEIYTEHKPDIVITDIQMPVMDGVEMSRRIKELNPTALIIVTTAFNEKPYIQKTQEIGITDYLKKPVVKDDLMQALRSCAEILLKRK
jgi:YesN/AraC family two-component response regulator